MITYMARKKGLYMFSILNEIKEYINISGIPFNNISINYSYFPPHYNQAILNHLRKLTGNNYDFGSAEYTLSFDKNGSIYLMIHDFHNKTNLCIANTRLNLEENIRITQVPEVDIIEEASALKLLDNERMLIRQMINTNYSNLSRLDRVKLENNIINTLILPKIRESIKNGEDIVEKALYNHELGTSVEKIIPYIDYLNDYYMEDLRLEEEENKMKGIYFNEPDSDAIIRRNPGKGSPQNKERNNPIIPANDRIDVLNSYHYIYRDFAYNDNNKEIKYINYLYRLSDNQFLLVMEPYNGTKYTKLAII